MEFLQPTMLRIFLTNELNPSFFILEIPSLHMLMFLFQALLHHITSLMPGNWFVSRTLLGQDCYPWFAATETFVTHTHSVSRSTILHCKWSPLFLIAAEGNRPYQCDTLSSEVYRSEIDSRWKSTLMVFLSIVRAHDDDRRTKKKRYLIQLIISNLGRWSERVATNSIFSSELSLNPKFWQVVWLCMPTHESWLRCT